MTVRTLVGLLSILSAGVAAAAPPVSAQVDEIPIYVGRSVCLECHVPKGAADPCTLEPIPEHGRAYKALLLPEAEDIAALCGSVGRPRESRVCLGCHSTASDVGPRWASEAFRRTEGVQCEACHDAGSLHVKLVRPDEEGGAATGPSRIRRGDRSTCLHCHVERPSHQAVLERGYRRPQADRLYKTPINIECSPDGRFLYVVCQNADSLVVVNLERGVVVKEIAVGRRPHGVAVGPDGGRLYVSNRLSDTVTVIDAAQLKAVDEIQVGDDPHGVVVDPSGRWLGVANTEGDTLSMVDLDKGRETSRLAAGRGPWSIALGPGGGSLCVTSVRPSVERFLSPPRSEITRIDLPKGGVIARPSVPDAGSLEGITYVAPRGVFLFTLMRVKSLVPVTRLAQGWTVTNGLGVLWPDGRVDQVLLDEPAAAFPDPMDVAASPDGRHALVTSGGADLVAVVDVEKLLHVITSASEAERRDILPNHMGLSGRFVSRRIAVGRNPRGVAFAPDGRTAYVANALDDTVSVIRTADYAVVKTIALGGPREVSETRYGERLFHSARKTFARQFSCRTCHPDGHINGLTLDIEADGIGMHPVDNRTLRGILDTAPYKWEGTNPTLHRQCGPRLAVFFTRLDPFSPTELDALVNYMCTIERPPNRYRRPDGLTLAQRRGRLVFERVTDNRGRTIPPDERCVTCHAGAYKTVRSKSEVGTSMWFDGPMDPDELDLFDVEAFGDLGVVFFAQTRTENKKFDVPHLNNIYNSPPYLHNGSARTLEEIWTRFNIYDWHGRTGDLTRRQFNDLIAYLKAL